MLVRVPVYIIELYQKYLRIVLPNSCRFYPSCSEYAKGALLKYGLCKGTFKALKRILSCHPFSKNTGYYPIL